MRNDLTPGSSGKIEINSILLCQIGRLDRSFQMITQKHVLFNDLVSFRVITKVKEERLKETATFFVDLPELGIVVPDQSVSVSDSGSHDVSVSEIGIV